jgi:hypothetical protein
MVTVQWKYKEPKKIRIKGEKASACLHFFEDETIDIPDVAWPMIEKKMKDALNTGKMIIVKRTKETVNIDEEEEEEILDGIEEEGD